MPAISVVTITKNSQDRIGEVVRNGLGFGSEVIVVDTGSTDETVAVAKDAGAVVAHFDGEFDYSTPRNYGSAAASGDWILHLDDDEWFDPQMKDRLYETVQDGRSAVYTLWQCDFVDGAFAAKYQPLGRLFQNGKAIFKGLVHEDLYPVCEFGIPNLHVVHRTAVRDRDEKFNSVRKRLAATEADGLLRGPRAPGPDGAAEWFSRARHLYELVDESHRAPLRKLAAEAYRRTKRQDGITPIVRMTAAMFQADRLKNYRQAIQILTKDLDSIPDTFQYQLSLGTVCFMECKVKQARDALHRALEIDPAAFFIYLKLGTLHEIDGDSVAAEAAFQKAREVYPEFPQFA